MKTTTEMDIREIGKALLKRLWIIALCAVIVGTSVFIYTKNFVAPMYQSYITVYVNNSSSTDNSYISSGDLAVALRLVSTYVNIITSDSVLSKVIDEAGLNITEAQVRGMITAEVIGETEMFKVSVTSPNPQMSKDIANTIAKVAPAEIAAIIEGSSAKIIDYARLPQNRCSPNYTTNTVIGFLVGALLAIAAIVIQNMLDTRLTKEEDLMNISSVPVLGRIPDMTALNKTAGKKVRR